jgi:sugar phosphate permease
MKNLTLGKNLKIKKIYGKINNDKIHIRSICMPFSMALASIFFILFGTATEGIVPLIYVFIFFCGVFLGAPYIIISSQIAAYLGRTPMLKGKN